MKKEILKNTTSSEYEQTHVYTLVSVESDLKICWIINNIFGINLSLSEDVKISLSGNPKSFKRYQFVTDNESERYLLVINRYEGNVLVSELKKIDYLFIIQSQNKFFSVENKIPEIKKHQEINAFIRIDPESIRSFNKILINV